MLSEGQNCMSPCMSFTHTHTHPHPHTHTHTPTYGIAVSCQTKNSIPTPTHTPPGEKLPFSSVSLYVTCFPTSTIYFPTISFCSTSSSPQSPFPTILLFPSSVSPQLFISNLCSRKLSYSIFF